MAVWTVKAGKHGEAEERCLAEGVIGKGGRVGDLAHISSQDELTQMWTEAYPEMSKQASAAHVGQMWSLIHRMQVGEMVVLPLKTRGTIAVGRVTGPYRYRPELEGELRHTRHVEWLHTDLPRDSFDQDLLYSFGAFSTVGRVRREQAEERILAVVEGRTPTRAAAEEIEESAAEIELDIETLAREQMRQFISQRFAGHDLARLVGAVLHAQGFTESVSPPGADRGVDILAGSGPLGLDSPRLAVQVKTGTAGVEEFRALRGVMEDFRAEQGLLVAWGGFKGTVKAEARHAHFSIRLWDAEDLMSEIFGAYDRLPDDLRSELPLQRVWTVVTPEA